MADHALAVGTVLEYGAFVGGRQRAAVMILWWRWVMEEKWIELVGACVAVSCCMYVMMVAPVLDSQFSCPLLLRPSIHPSLHPSVQRVPFTGKPTAVWYHSQC